MIKTDLITHHVSCREKLTTSKGKLTLVRQIFPAIRWVKADAIPAADGVDIVLLQVNYLASIAPCVLHVTEAVESVGHF